MSTTIVLTRLGFLLITFGIFISRFALSMGMIFLVFNFLCEKNIRGKIKEYLHRKHALLFESIFFVYLLSGIYSENLGFFLERIQLVLPLLVLPVSFSVIRISKKELGLWLVSFTLLTFLASGFSFVNYLTVNNKTFVETGPLMSTCIEHIQFSLTVVISILVGIYFYFQKNEFFFVNNIIITLVTVFLLFYLHLNGVRSGIVSFYIGLLAFCFLYRKKTNILKISIILGAICLFLITMFYSLPHFKYKVVNTVTSITEVYIGEEVTNASDFGRVESVQTGIEIGKASILFGVGIGDLKELVDKKSKLNLLPHNQFVFIFAFSGLFGLSIFIFSIVRLLLCRPREYALFIGINCIFLFYFWFNHLLERQIGLAIFLYFNLLILSVSSGGQEPYGLTYTRETETNKPRNEELYMV